MNSCTDPGVATMDQCVGEFYPADVGLCNYLPNGTMIYECNMGLANYTFPRVWGPWTFGSANYDNIFNAMNIVTQVRPTPFNLKQVVICTTAGLCFKL